MLEVEKIRELWEKHEASPVPPGFRSLIIDGLSLTQIHCDIAANILTYINTGGRLGSHRVNTLQQRRSLLEQSIEKLPTESRAYFERLNKISDLVLKQPC